MPRPRNPFPKPRCHKGYAVVDIYDGNRRRTITLGLWKSPQAEEEFARLLGELKVTNQPAGRPNTSVNELLLAFLRFAERHYVRADGSQTGEVAEYKRVMRHLRELYGHSPAKEFGPLAFKAVRQRFIDQGCCRTLVNQRANRVRHIFKWAAAEELVPPATYQALATVAGLQRGRCQVRESEPVLPVTDAVIDATLPHLTRHVRGLVEFQRLTGCRPGEACAVRRVDIDTGGPIWFYRPSQHKSAWRGKPRVIAIGPKAQAVLRDFFTPDPGDYLFSPRIAVQEFHAHRAANRKTPRYGTHPRTRVKDRVKQP